MLNVVGEPGRRLTMIEIEEAISEARRYAISPTHETALIVEAVRDLLNIENKHLHERIAALEASAS
jgi:tetrahydromethanopterin S-methyltransferase subunit B